MTPHSADLARAPGALRSRAARPAPRGQITWVGLLLLAAVASAAYLGWIWVPIWFDHYTVKQIVRDYMNQAVKNRDDAVLRSQMVAKIAALVETDGLDAAGNPVRVPAVVVAEQDVTWDRTSGPPPRLHVAFEYEREIVYPFANRTATARLAIDEQNDLSAPDWGPAR
jgi:hypothetical protein